MIEDIGSGWIGELPPPAALGDEPAPRSSIAAGADAVLFSADKLLGGPQAGIIAGRASLIEAVRRHPLMRAVRVDKMTYAALEATLQEYAAGRAAETIPVARMLALGVAAIRHRAQALSTDCTAPSPVRYWMDSRRSAAGAPQGQRSRLRWSR